MPARYVEPEGPRFTTEFVDGVEQIRIPARRSIVALLFLCVWLTIWMIGGLTAVRSLFVRFEPFMLVWTCGWALGLVFAVTAVGWQVTGAEILRFTGGDLEVSRRLFGFTQRRLFRGRDISDVAVSTVTDPDRAFRLNLPFFATGRSGRVRFDYGARTVYLAEGLDEAEGRLIVDHLRRRLPRAASAQAGSS